MNKKQQNPKQDWGFYAVTPRIVRTQYKDLSHAEKWLYTCLKDLCGDKGSCFRSLRSLSEETDISIASLSKMIPNLHKVGLIHAQKKRRSQSGKEVWHITIVDIWQENAKHCKDCSKNEQSQEVVQNSNNDQKGCSENAQGCSENAQTPELDCSNFSNRRRDSKNNTEEGMNDTSATDSTNQQKDTFTPSSTHSISSVSNRSNPTAQVEHLSTTLSTGVDNQASSELPIATGSTNNPALTNENPYPLTTRNTSSSANVPSMPDLPSKPTQRNTEPLDPDTPGIQRIDGYWQQKGLRSRLPVAKEHWRTLSKCIQCFEDFESLFRHVQDEILKDPAMTSKTVNPGNLTYAKYLDGWVQKRQREQAPKAEPEKQVVTVGNRHLQRFK